MTRGRVCRLRLLLVLASAFILGSVSRGTCDNILLSQIRDFYSRIHECTVFYNFHTAGIEVTMSNISSILFCCHGNDLVNIRCRGNNCLLSSCLARVTSASNTILAFRQCLHSRCLANGYTPSHCIADDIVQSRLCKEIA
jgi:hypothetical protein